MRFKKDREICQINKKHKQYTINEYSKIISRLNNLIKSLSE